jgi:GNAT superfamily N-acetyltransferase
MADVRRAESGDLGALIELHRQFCDVDGHPYNLERARTAFTPLLADDTHGVVWIVDTPGAYAVLTWGWSIEAGGPEAVLDEIFVSDRDRGVGSALLVHALADGRRRGLARIFLETEARNERVRRFYARHEFNVDDSIWLSYEFTDLS